MSRVIDSLALASVQWPRLLHAYGSAADTPEHLRALRSSDGQERREARSELISSIVHQGSRYEASAIAVPFLVDLAADPEVADRHRIVELLLNLAVGAPYRCLPGGWPIAANRAALAVSPPDLSLLEAVRAYLLTPRHERQGRFPLDRDQNRRFEAHFAIQTYDAVRAALPTVRGLLYDTDTQVATAAAVTLAYFPENAEASVAELVAAVGDTENLMLTANAMLAIALLGGPVPEAGLDRCLADEDEVIRWAASCATVIRHEVNAPATAVATLQEIGRQDSDREAPYWQQYPPTSALDALAAFHQPAFEQLADELLDVYLRPQSERRQLEQALTLAWRTRPAHPVPFSQLTAPQQAVARWLAGHPEQWMGDGFTAGAFRVELDRYGLPTAPEQLLLYVTAG
ncbi:MAG: hypothetical protein HOV77_14735 [Hamadaea sp.]|uniref:hypothetical protein n=1 Tax=Hamadaea sp. TaxID=2024425 RepID=UPI001813CC24|nr:hypothetical protein [Hamadaea sp.]NUT20439.1 hypothetical protein [Hamadaea sp.]